MDATRFDTIAKLLAGRRSRRRALAEAGSGIAAGALAVAGLARPVRAQDDPDDGAASPVASAAGNDGPTMLYVQAFQGGSISPLEGVEGRHVLTLQQGLGHTVFFSDRPDRIVGATPTPRFLAELGFPDDDPPNAALVVETAEGQTDVAVVELFAPAYNEASHTAVYQVATLASWERPSDGDVAATETDLAGRLPSFEAAHLFIDSLRGPGTPDCAQSRVYCYNACDSPPYADLGSGGLCWSVADQACRPCGGSFDPECNGRFPDHCSSGQCFASSSFHAVCG